MVKEVPLIPPRTRNRGLGASSGGKEQSSLANAEGALRQVKKDWRTIMTPDFNPVPLALELLDNSSLGKDLSGFESLLATLNTTVEEVVNDHYRQFSSTTAIFTGVQTEINMGSTQVQTMKAELLRCKEILKTQRSDLNVLWSKAKQYKEMLRILETLDEIKLVPDRLETLFRDKYYLTGIRLLITTLKSLDTPELAPIKATAEIRRTLNKLKNNLHEALIEEIHNHVYLKIHLNEEFENISGFNNIAKFEEMVAKYLFNDFDDQNLPVTSAQTIEGDYAELEEDLTTDPEADSLNFLRIVIISLKLIGKLPEALAMIKTRVPVELYQLVDKTINEVDARREKGDFGTKREIHSIENSVELSGRGNSSDGISSTSSDSLTICDESAGVSSGEPGKIQVRRAGFLDSGSYEILGGFIERLYQKFVLVLSYHRFIVVLTRNLYTTSKTPMSPFPEEPSTVVNPTKLNRRVSWMKFSREAEVPDYNTKEVWASVQSEIRSILFDYITDPQLQNMAASDAISSINESMKGRGVRDVKKQLFRFSSEATDLSKKSQSDQSDQPDNSRSNHFDGHDSLGPPLASPESGEANSLSGQDLYEKVRSRINKSAGSDVSKRIFDFATQDSPFQIPNDGLSSLNSNRLRNRDVFPENSSNSAQANALTINLASIAVDKYSFSSKLSTEHRLLTSPDIYNISLLFPHTMVFFDRAQTLLHLKNEDYISSEGFLQDFFSNTFLPQMELKAQQHLTMATTGSHAFQISTKHVSTQGRPLLNCVGELISLVGNLCTTLQSLPFQREEYIRIIEHVLEAFLEKCQSCFKGIVVTNSGQDDEHSASGSIVSSIWAQSPELLNLFKTHPYIKKLKATNSEFFTSQKNPVYFGGYSGLDKPRQDISTNSYQQFGSYFSDDTNHESLNRLNEKEMEIEIQLKQKRSLHTSELLFDVKKISLLATLAHSMKWFVAQVSDMIGSGSPMSSSNLSSSLSNASIILSSADPDGQISDKPPTIREMTEFSSHFDSLLVNFRNLADLCLFTLRVEIRCHTMYYLDLAVREGIYYIKIEDPISPDSYLTTLNSDLADCEESLRDYLTVDDLRFVFDQLTNFMSRVLISTDNVRNIGKMSQRGLEKMLLNIAALQQNLTNLGFFNDQGLSLARSFYTLYDLDLETFSQRAQAQGILFTHGEYKSLLDLTLETLHYETTLPASGSQVKLELKNKLAKRQNSISPEVIEDRQVNDLIIQSYHEQLMALRELTSKEEE